MDLYKNNDFFMVIEDVFSIRDKGVAVTGTIRQGVVRVNDVVMVNDTQYTVKMIDVLHLNQVEYATKGMNVGLHLSATDARLFRRGDVVTSGRLMQTTPNYANNFTQPAPSFVNTQNASAQTRESQIISEATVNDFKKYTNPYNTKWMIATIILAVLAVVNFILTIVLKTFAFQSPLVLLALSLLTFVPYAKGEKTFKDIQAAPDYNAILSDFANALPMRDNRIRFGEKRIFVKNSGVLLRYDEIKQVYQYVHRTNFVEDERAVKYVNSKGKHKKLCKLELNEKSNPELVQIFAIIRSKNPNVKIGYR